MWEVAPWAKSHKEVLRALGSRRGSHAAITSPVRRQWWPPTRGGLPIVRSVLYIGWPEVLNPRELLYPTQSATVLRSGVLSCDGCGACGVVRCCSSSSTPCWVVAVVTTSEAILRQGSRWVVLPSGLSSCMRAQWLRMMPIHRRSSFHCLQEIDRSWGFRRGTMVCIDSDKFDSGLDRWNVGWQHPGAAHRQCGI